MFQQKLRYLPYHGIQVLRWLIQEGDICIDMGASMGLYTFTLAKQVGAKGQVWAIEPNPYCAALLRSYAEKHQWKQVKVINKAVVEQPTEPPLWLMIPILRGIPRHARGTIVKHPSQAPYKQCLRPIPVNTIDVHRLLYPIKQVDYIKIDIEGYEQKLLPAMLPYLQNRMPMLQVEMGFSSRKVLLPLLKKLYEKVAVRKGRKLRFITWESAMEYPCSDLYFIPERFLNRVYQKNLFL